VAMMVASGQAIRRAGVGFGATGQDAAAAMFQMGRVTQAAPRPAWVRQPPPQVCSHFLTLPPWRSTRHARVVPSGGDLLTSLLARSLSPQPRCFPVPAPQGPPYPRVHLPEVWTQANTQSRQASQRRYRLGVRALRVGGCGCERCFLLPCLAQHRLMPPFRFQFQQRLAVVSVMSEAPLLLVVVAISLVDGALPARWLLRYPQPTKPRTSGCLHRRKRVPQHGVGSCRPCLLQPPRAQRGRMAECGVG